MPEKDEKPCWRYAGDGSLTEVHACLRCGWEITAHIKDAEFTRCRDNEPAGLPWPAFIQGMDEETEHLRRSFMAWWMGKDRT